MEHPYTARVRLCTDAASVPCRPGEPRYRLARCFMRTANRLATLAWQAS